MDRYYSKLISEDAFVDHKMAFLSGPRQVGKTYLAKAYLKSEKNYFNWDDTEFKRTWIRSPLQAVQGAEAGPLVLDEIHKYKKWKPSLKGLFDHIGSDVPILVTGSAKMDLYKKRGKESLMGRYLNYRLHPFTVSERIKDFPDPDQLSIHKTVFPIQDLLRLSGFPEPLLKGSEAKAKRWSRLCVEQMLNFDVKDFANIQDMNSFEVLAEILPQKVGSPLSLNSLREDLSVAYASIRSWVRVLEAVYYCFRIKPYAKNIVRSLKKEPKLYVFDITKIKDEGIRLENLVALHLLKVCQFWTDTAVGEFELCYIRNKQKEEVDFCLLREGEPWMLVECKSQKTAVSSTLKKFSDLFPKAWCFQLTLKNTDKKILGTKIRLISVEKFLSMFI